MTILIEDFGLQIKAGRIVRGLRKSELAKRVGITAQYMADIERGAVPSEEIIEKLIGALELDEVETFKLADKVPLRVIQKAKLEYYGGVNLGKKEEIATSEQ